MFKDYKRTKSESEKSFIFLFEGLRKDSNFGNSTSSSVNRQSNDARSEYGLGRRSGNKSNQLTKVNV